MQWRTTTGSRVIKVTHRGKRVLSFMVFSAHLSKHTLNSVSPNHSAPSIFLSYSGPPSGFCKVYPTRTSSESSGQLRKWHILLLCTNNCTHGHTQSAVARQDAVLACHCKCSCRPSECSNLPGAPVQQHQSILFTSCNRLVSWYDFFA